MSKKIDLKFVNGSAPYLSDENINYMVGIVNDNADELDDNTKSINTRIDQVSEDIRDIEHGIIPPAVIEEQVENYVQSHQATLATKSEVKSLKNGEHGGYNLIPFPYFSPTRYVNNGITYTVNADGSVTVNGTATSASSFQLANRTKASSQIKISANKTYRLMGCPKNGGSLSYRVNCNDSTGTFAYSDFGEGVELKPTKDYLMGFFITIANGCTANNLTFHPMLVEVNSDGSYPTEYERWIPSVQNIEDNKAENTTISDIFDIEKSYSVGDYFISDNVLYKVKVACSGVQPPNTTYYEASNVISALNQGLMNLIEIKEVTKTTASDGMIWSIPVVEGKLPYMAVVTSSYTYNLKCDVIKAGTQNVYGLKVFYWLNGYNALDNQSVTVKILYA